MNADLPIPAIADVEAAADDASQCRWRPSGAFALIHRSGWPVARYPVDDEWRYLLWEPIDRCAAANGNQFHGPNDHVRDAMHLHRDLSAHLRQQEMAA
ncbi:hypothetical protein [Burkholderia sp. WP9]|uniref:hypothetical protein n=1 Tax=Burkholderia sp. WP9 TaxID=1500263 RepID=UPI000B88E788|nr:hypothetical protein [Burkholderia sp. WP9]